MLFELQWRSELATEYGPGLHISVINYADSKYEKLIQEPTEVVIEYFKINSFKPGILGFLEWYFNEEKRARKAAAFRILRERNVIDDILTPTVISEDISRRAQRI